MTGLLQVNASVTAGISEAVAIPAGFIFVGISVPEMTSTTFTISSSPSGSISTFRILRDGLGALATAGTDVTWTMGATSVGVYYCPPALSAVLDGNIKVTFDQSETAGITLLFRNIA